MEWAVNKNYDIYRPNTGKLLLPGARIWWEDASARRRRRDPRPRGTGGLSSIRRVRNPSTAPYLTLFSAIADCGQTMLDIPPNSIAQTQGFHVLQSPARLENFQPHMHLRGKAM